MPHISRPDKFWSSPHGRPLPQDFWKRTLLMGIVNATPDSFSDGGKCISPEIAARHARELVEAGADIIDLGAESTRPGSTPIDEKEELKRLIPALKAIRENLPDTPISVDTSHARVAEKAIEAGADILNDVCAIGVQGESAENYTLGKVAAINRTPLIAMHNRVDNPQYRDFTKELLDDLRSGVDRILNCGIPEENLWLDPGFGFGKSPAQNLEIVAKLNQIASIGFPILLGTSRKSTLGLLLGGKAPKERNGGDDACAALGSFHGASCLRLHDIAIHKDCVIVADAIFNANRCTIKTD